jgi:MFS family permease
MSNAEVSNVAIAPNAKRLLIAGFMAIFAAGVGMGIRNGILDNWGREFGFTGAQLGDITGAAFLGFCPGIILGGIICDKVGYGKLVIAAFVLHVLSAFVTFATTVGQPQLASFRLLYWGMFIFSFANGTLEAVANPLVATLYPQNRAHFLNLLHASWPGGMILGTVAGWILDDKMQINWKIQLALYLVPTAIYGLMFLGQHMPKSEASVKGIKLGDMFKDVGILGALIICYLLSLFFGGPLGMSPGYSYALAGVLLITVAVMTRFSMGSWLLFFLFVAHAMVGAVELGTDAWITNITGNLFTSEKGRWLFIWTSTIMFSLRFCADFIEKKIGLSPVGILLTCSVLACVGLNLSSTITTFGGALLALAVYAVGKTFFWPTMLAVASDRFPRTGAIAISMMGGIGMLSAGLIGGPGLGYCKDRFAGEELIKTNPAVFEQYEAPQPSRFLNLEFTAAYGFDGTKFGAVETKLARARDDVIKAGGDPVTALDMLSPDERAVHEAGINGDRKTLKTDSFIPAAMAVIYLLILLYFKAIGGYKPVHIVPLEEQAAGEAKAATS